MSSYLSKYVTDEEAVNKYDQVNKQAGRRSLYSQSSSNLSQDEGTPNPKTGTPTNFLSKGSAAKAHSNAVKPEAVGKVASSSRPNPLKVDDTEDTFVLVDSSPMSSRNADSPVVLYPDHNNVEWIEYRDDESGSMYYCNQKTNEVTWEIPAKFTAYALEPPGLSPGWRESSVLASPERSINFVNLPKKKDPPPSDDYIRKQWSKPSIPVRRRARTQSAAATRRAEEARLEAIEKEKERLRLIEEEKRAAEERERLDRERRHAEQEKIRLERIRRQESIELIIQQYEERETLALIQHEEEGLETLQHLCSIQDWDGIAFRLSNASVEELRETDNKRMTALHLAFQAPEAPLELCVNIFKSNPEVTRWRSSEGKLPLHYLLQRSEAHYKSKPEVAAKVLSIAKLVEAEFKEAVEAQDSDGVTPFAVACNQCHPTIIKYLVETCPHGLSVPSSNGDYPLCSYVLRPDASVDIATVLLSHESDELGLSSAIHACPISTSSSAPALSRLLLTHNETPLTLAKTLDWEGVKTLARMRRGDFGVRDDLGMTPLMHASLNCSSLDHLNFIFKVCTQALPLQDSQGKNALHHLLEGVLGDAEKEKVANKFTLQSPAVLTQVDTHGDLPLHVACRSCNGPLIALVFGRSKVAASESNANLKYPSMLLDARGDEVPRDVYEAIKKEEDRLLDFEQKHFTRAIRRSIGMEHEARMEMQET